MGRPETGNRDGENVLCPLFISFTDNEIRCQAHVPDASSTSLKYSDKKSCYLQRKTFCEGCWKRCEQWLAWKHFRWEEDE